MARLQALNLCEALLYELLTACLHGEVRLCERDFRFVWVSVLGD